MDEFPHGTGAEASPLDIRTFTFAPTFLGAYLPKGGARYGAANIEDQSKVGICTAISVTQNARKATGKPYSADFQYLIQKKFYDKNWNEGSSGLHALKAAYTHGFLPLDEWKHTTQNDRKLSYSKYIAKLKAVSEDEIDRLLNIAAQHKIISAYANVPVERDAMAAAISESKAGIIARFLVGKEWYTDKNGKKSYAKEDIEPLRSPRLPITGHLITLSNYDGNSFRTANTWGTDWADVGTAYLNLLTYQPTECWAVWYQDEILPPEIVQQQKSRKELLGQILNTLQKIVDLYNKLLKN